MPLNVAATSVKFAIPPPMRSARLRPSGFAVAHCQSKKGNLNVKDADEDDMSVCYIYQILIANSYIKDNSGVLKDLIFIWSTTVLSVVTKFRCIAQISNLINHELDLRATLLFIRLRQGRYISNFSTMQIQLRFIKEALHKFCRK